MASTWLYNESQLKAGIIDRTLQVLVSEPLPDDGRPIPYFKWLMKLFSALGLPDDQRIFN